MTTERTRTPLSVIEPPHGWHLPNLRELWEHRELLFYLTLRDLRVRYQHTVLGIGWVILHPMVSMIIYTVLFGGLARLPSDNLPYAVFAFAGLVPWGFFSNSVIGASNSLSKNAGLAAKVYFPRLVLVFAAIFPVWADAVITFIALQVLMLAFGIFPGIGVIALPAFVLLAIITALGVGIWLAALSVQYRDVSQIPNLLMTVWLYASPVIYSPSLIPAGWASTLYWLNPMAHVLQGFRWALLGAGFPPIVPLLISTAGALVLLTSGLIYFERVERTFVDLI